jgi:hypothetical protein
MQFTASLRAKSATKAMQVRAVVYLIVGLIAESPASAVAQIDQLKDSYDFLVTESTAGGVLFNFSVGESDYVLPRSFYDTGAYWGAFVCAGSRATCAVNDAYNGIDFQLSPPPGAAGKLQVERVNAHSGANIYDAATWQIAVMLGYVKNKFGLPYPTGPYAFVSNLTDVLQHSGLRSEGVSAPGAKRATSAGNTFIYNGRFISDGSRAYAFRTLAPEWLARDPLVDSPYAGLITASNLPLSNPAYETGKVTWSDWKPITGENAWAFLIGPLQAAYIEYVLFEDKKCVPLSDLAVQNALDMLSTFAAMQSTLGAVYYAPAGTIGNEGDSLVNPHQVAVENNLSLYAGLRILRATLNDELRKDTALGSAGKTKINDALQLIDVMISGGQLDKDRRTKGLISFFREAAWQSGSFVQGGLADEPGLNRDWIPTREPMAVDVETWGIAALGARQIDQWFGYGASFEMWQNLKTWGAYGVGKALWGVGYSDKDGNGIDQSGAYKQGIMSAEWTAGAIDAVRNMLSYYGSERPSSSHYSSAQKYLATLKQDESTMLRALGKLRIDRYTSTDFPGKPDAYAKLISLKTKPYLYGSRRYHIPFGWYANPIPSTASTAWVIMIANHYDPFGIGGAPN